MVVDMKFIDFLENNREEVISIAERHGVTSIKVFGSVARKQDIQTSDVDFLVTTGSDVSAWFPAGLIVELEDVLGRSVDVVTIDGLNPMLRDHVLTEAIAL